MKKNKNTNAAIAGVALGLMTGTVALVATKMRTNKKGTMQKTAQNAMRKAGTMLNNASNMFK